MFNHLRKTVVERINFLKRDSATTSCFLNTRFLIRSKSTNSTNQNSFTVSYLINSCGLSEENAISNSKRVQLETTTNPDSVLALFKNKGFSSAHISKIIQKFPQLLNYSVHQTLGPKFDFFNSVGLSGPDLAKAISAYPAVLNYSLEKRIIPSFDFLKSIVQTESKIITILKGAVRVLTKDPHKELLPNIMLLRANGVPDSNIAYLFEAKPRALMRTCGSFFKIVEAIKKMGFDSSQCLFVIAINGLSSMKKSTLEAKFDVYRRWGWSEEEIHCAYRKQPYCMMISEKKIMVTMDHLVNKMGYNPSLLAKQPGILLFSFERRILPRCLVIQVLRVNGLLENDSRIRYLINMKEKEFLNFIAKFEKKVPGLLNTYLGEGRCI